MQQMLREIRCYLWDNSTACFKIVGIWSREEFRSVICFYEQKTFAHRNSSPTDFSMLLTSLWCSMSEDGAESLQMSEQLPPQPIKDGSESSSSSGTDIVKTTSNNTCEVAGSTIMLKWQRQFVNGCEVNSHTSTEMEFLKSPENGDNTSICLVIM